MSIIKLKYTQHTAINISLGEVELYSKNKESSVKSLKNYASHTEPLIVHGNGPSKITLNSLGNYIAGSWNDEEGCVHCKLGTISLDNFSELPTVLIAIFVEYPTPFLEEQLEKVYAIDYPKDKTHLFIHNTVS